MDNSDFGPGRLRLCLAPPASLTLERTAWCEWNGDRTMVTQVSGHPGTVGSTQVDAFISFALQDAGVSLTDGSRWDDIVYYDMDRQPMSIDSDEAHVTGRVAVDLGQTVDPELGIVVGAPSAVVGTIAWICGDPPAPG